MCTSSISKNTVHIHYLKKYFISEKCWPTSEPLVNHNLLLVEGLALMLMAHTDQGGDCWKLGWLWQFLKIKQWNQPYRLTLPFMNSFSVACSAVWHHFTHRTFQSEVNYLKPCCCVFNSVYGIFEIFCFHFNILHSILTRSRFHLKKLISLLLLKKQVFIHSGFILRSL